MNLQEVANKMISLESQFADVADGIDPNHLKENFQDKKLAELSKKRVLGAVELNNQIMKLIKERKNILCSISPGLVDKVQDIGSEEETE